MKTIIIAALAEGRVIGKAGRLPWHYQSDMRHFKDTTMGHPCVMGRKTYESLPERPLPGRENIVLSRNEAYEVEAGVSVCTGMAEARELCESSSADKMFVLGGQSVFSEALNEADEMLLTIVPDQVKGDTFFPEWDKAQWEEVRRQQGEDGLQYVTYTRRRPRTD